MQVTETKNEGLEREFSIKVDAAEIEEKVSARLDELKRTVQIPGFRPGKVPASLMRKNMSAPLWAKYWRLRFLIRLRKR